jgi:hypothetical protein
LSEYGVPDDDMSDSLPPNGGPEPFDGWDLEGLLSGERVWLPDGMRPVAGTLGSLRSAPTRAELSAEAAARVAFREFMQASGSGPVLPGGSADEARTLILPARTADAGPHVVPRPRPRHAHRKPSRWGSKALVGAVGGVAAVVIVGGSALAGVFSGGIGHPGLLGGSSGAASAAPQTSPAGSNEVEGTASTEPTASPTTSNSAGQQSSGGANAAPGPSELCRQYLDFFTHPGSSAGAAAGSANFQQLSNLAGGARHILGYCMELQPWAQQGSESFPGGLGFPPAGPGDSQDAGGSPGQDRLGQQDAGSPNGQSVNAPGPGSQN